MVVKVDLGVVQLAVSALEAGLEDVAVLNADVLSRVVERHCRKVGFGRLWMERETGLDLKKGV